jgi:hypothetical protein
MGSLQTPFLLYDGHMKNTHLEHPEDSVLLGKKAVQDTINYLRNCKGSCSVKYDGAPAIVFGTNPENGKFFVGTKSVFNKVKVKINYTHDCIERNHGNNQKVAAILHTCLEVLPQVDGIYQGDFIGYGGKHSFTPNTLSYSFDCADVTFLDTSIVFVAHTSYFGDSMKELTASFDIPEHLKYNFLRTRFINPDAQFATRSRRIDFILGLASVISNFVKYPETKKEQEELKIAINKCIRENHVIDCIDGNLLWLFDLLTQAKLLIMEGIEITGDQVDAKLDLDIDCIPGHEGYVHSNEFGSFKLVNRRIFSHYNFTKPKDW